ncbi:hypothetical protein Y032_0160g3360 [Ancylostoma ceylanicum]|nr:hypothetical protein Y032_0160g3360 [Ancylostoma ceylanicum]
MELWKGYQMALTKAVYSQGYCQDVGPNKDELSQTMERIPNGAHEVQDNMLSVIRKFLTSAPPGCDVEISVKYNLAKDNPTQVRSFTTRMNTSGPASVSNMDKNRSTDGKRSSTPVMARKLRSEERVALKDAVPILTPTKKTESTGYEMLLDSRKVRDGDEVNVSAESFRNPSSEKKTKTKTSQSSDMETDEIATSELFPVKKALRYNKNSGKYDDISY